MTTVILVSSPDQNRISQVLLMDSTVPPSVFYSMPARNRPVTPPQNAPTPTSTPISNKAAGSYTYASKMHDRESANFRLASETSGRFLGAMPPIQFLDRFLPISKDVPKCSNGKGAFAGVRVSGREVDMYAPFVSMVLFLHLLYLTNTR